MGTFEFWKMDRATAKETILAREDEDALCEALSEIYPDLMVIPDRFFPTPEVPVARRISDFPALSPSAGVLGSTLKVSVEVPLAGWEPESEVCTYPWVPPSPVTYVLKHSSPLSLLLFRSQELGPGLNNRPVCARPALLDGRLNISYCSEGPYVEAQRKWIRDFRRVFRRIATNRIKWVTYENGRPVSEEVVEKGGDLWVGYGALRWAAADPERVLLDGRKPRGRDQTTGEVQYAARPID